MEIRKILNLLESDTQFKKLSRLKEQPTSDQIATAALNNPTGTAKPTSTVGQVTQSAPAPKTYGAGYDPNKVQYAYTGGKPTAPPPPSANLDAAKKAAFSGTTQPPPVASAAASANLDAAKTAAVGGTTQPVNNQSSGMTAQAQAQKPAAEPAGQAAQPAPAAVSPSGGGAVAAFGKTNMANAAGGTATPAPAPTATADVSGATKGIPAAFGKMAEDELEEDIEETVEEELAEMMRLSGLQLNEKAVSRQQQKFMGMVHAMQKGEKVKGASAELKAAAKGMSKKAAKDFASTKHKGLPKKVTEDVMLDEGGSTLNHIANRFKYEVKMFMQAGVMDNDLYEALSDYYVDRGEVPYGVAKGKPGFPEMTQWVEERFYADMGSNMSESAHMYEVVEDPLNELAKLAGLEEDGPGQFGMPNSRSMSATPSKTVTDKSENPMAQFAADLEMPPLPFFSKKEKADYEAMKAKKDERQFQQSGSAYSDDARVRYDRLGNPKEYFGLRSKDYFDPKPNRDRDLYNMQHDPAFKNIQKESVDLTECGDDMDMDSQEDAFNVSTNMSSDGTKNVTISAEGDRADELLQMLKMAGMRPHDDHDHSRMSKPEIIMIGGNNEMMEREVTPVPDDGNVLGDPHDFEEIDEAKKRVTRYSNTPDEEYQSVKSITDQGNDLNRQKRQYAGKPRLGDNPMAESILDSDLNAMLESILLRDDKNDPEIKKDPKTGRVSTTYPAPKKPDQSTLPLQTEPYHGPRSLKVDGERTGTEDSGKEKEVDEGLEDVSNFFGDIFNTDDSIRRRSQQYRDLEAMQQKYKPGTPEYDQLEKRKGYQKERYYGDKGEVVDKHGEPIKVLPPDQWKGN